jgi:catechol 2,3-dioxygenase-like lactoylglutathione lyase family enzyme
MNSELKIKMHSFTLDCKDPLELAKFYAALLGWEIVFNNEEYVVAGAPGTRQGTYPGITFQRNPQYKPPVWPDEPDAQQQMAHVDVAVNDLEKAVQHAIHCGATVSDAQFSDDWRVMFDPAGHPFCLCLIKHIFTANE